MAGLVARIVSLIAGLGATVLAVHLLSLTDYGVLASGLAVVAIGSVLALLGLGPAVVREVAASRARGHDREIVTLVNATSTLVLFAGLMASLVVVVVLTLTQANLSSSEFAVLSCGLSLLVFGRAATVVYATFARANGRMWLMAFATPLAIVLQLIALVALSLLGLRKLSDVGIAFSGVGLFALLLAMVLTGRTVVRRRRWFRINIREAVHLLVLAGPYAIAGVAAQVIRNLDVVILSATHPSRAVAIYYPPLRVTDSLLLLLPGLFIIGFTPLATSLYVRTEDATLEALYRLTTKIIVAASAPLLVLMIAVPDALLTVLLGAPFESAANLVRILSIGYTVNMAFGLNTSTLSAVGDRRSLALVNITALVGMVLLALVLIPPFGAVGAAVSTSVSVCVLNLAVGWAVYKNTRIHPLHLDIMVVLVSLIVPTFLAWLLEPHLAAALARVLLALGLGIAWWVFLFVTRMVSMREIRMLLPKRPAVGEV